MEIIVVFFYQGAAVVVVVVVVVVDSEEVSVSAESVSDDVDSEELSELPEELDNPEMQPSTGSSMNKARTKRVEKSEISVKVFMIHGIENYCFLRNLLTKLRSFKTSK